MRNHNRGFTLAEMAIAITVIALIIGGVLAGRNLLRVAQVNSILADVEFYKSAVKTFRTKYNYLPGDMATATNFWGTDSSGCPYPASNSPKVGTCNGDGNGQIDFVSNETFHVWQQLANAGMIPGSYSGYYGWTPGVTVPKGKLPGSVFCLYWVGTITASWYTGNWGNLLIFMDPGLTGVLTIEEAQALDKKADDGMPGLGKIVVFSSPSTCVTSWTNASSTYNLSYAGSAGCTLAFVTDF